MQPGTCTRSAASPGSGSRTARGWRPIARRRHPHRWWPGLYKWTNIVRGAPHRNRHRGANPRRCPCLSASASAGNMDRFALSSRWAQHPINLHLHIRARRLLSCASINVESVQFILQNDPSYCNRFQVLPTTQPLQYRITPDKRACMVTFGIHFGRTAGLKPRL
jgi:hypothetical protein